MILFHLGDLHIGKNLGEFSLIDDQKYILNQILELAKEKHADGILISGDVYDKAIPSETAVEVLDRFLGNCVKAGQQVFLISGNHDSDERLNFGSSLFDASGIHICAKYDGSLKKVTLSDKFGPVNVYLLPFVKASQVRHFFPEAEIPDYDAAVRQAIEAGNVDAAQRNILLAHQFVTDSDGKLALSGSESQSVQNVGTVEVIHADAFSAFDYTALGHIHSAQAVGSDCVRYSGSPLKYSKSEVHSAKTVTMITLGEKGSVSIDELPLHPMRDMRLLKGLDTDLLHPNHITSPEDFIFVTLTNKEPIQNAMALFQAYYPNTVNIEYDQSDCYAEETDFAADVENRTFMELVADFFNDVYHMELTDDHRRILEETAKEAGVLYEAD